MSSQTVAPRMVGLIEELTRLTGESPETAVEIALRERLERLETPEVKEKRQAEVQALVDKLAALFKQHPEAMVDHGELLYGEDGLPREGDLSKYELRFYFPERYNLPEARTEAKHGAPD